MALGYCVTCEKLCTITPGAQKWGSREREWYPVTHWVDYHTTCRTPVSREDKVCIKCGPIHYLDIDSMQCPGDKKAIK